MNRGSDSAWALAESSQPAFNEAPIHESGKCPDLAEDDPSQCPFNEAPIHESGK